MGHREADEGRAAVPEGEGTSERESTTGLTLYPLKATIIMYAY